MSKFGSWLGIVSLGLLVSCSSDTGANDNAASVGTSPTISADKADDCPALVRLEGPCRTEDLALSLIDMQTIGSHNSYKIAIPENELKLIAMTSPDAARGLDYGHIPIEDQLDLGMRQLEIDVARDPDGGLYADPALPKMFAGQEGAVAIDTTGLDQPGYKVLHVQDIDARTHCKTFVACLETVNAWSLDNPDHVPILILVNLKSGAIDIPGTVEAPAFTSESFDVLDAELRSVLSPDRLITPDDVRGAAGTLRQGVLSGGWPSLQAARGKLIFALDTGEDNVSLYIRDRTSLEGLPMFVNSLSQDADHAAYFTMNNPLRQGDEINARVEQGFLIRTRADANTEEARSGDTSKREAALRSGAQYISTDYYQPRTEWSDFQVVMPGGGVARCNPVRRNDCAN